MTLVQFILAYEGYRRRQEDEWDRFRHLGAWIVNGYASEKVSAMELVPLKKDDYDKIRPVTSRDEAIRLVKSML